MPRSLKALPSIRQVPLVLAFPEESAMDKMVFSQGTITSYNAQGEPLLKVFPMGLTWPYFKTLLKG